MMMKETVIALLKERGVELKQIAEIVLDLQKPYRASLTFQECLDSVEKVVEKREVQNAVLTGVVLDMLAEKDGLPEPLLSMVKSDDSLYGTDEILALGITNIYGSVGFTSFGYIDKRKMGILKKLNRHGNNYVNTFLDDLVAGIAAAACARIAHHNGAVL